MGSVADTASSINIAGALDTIWELGNGAIDFIISNPVTTVMLVFSLVPMGFALLKMSKRASRA